MKEIAITINKKKYQGQLNDTEIAAQIYQELPLKGEANFWGHEIYFEIPIQAGNEQPTEDLEIGDLAYWPQGNSLCIFYGKTPASVDESPKPAGPVTVVGKVTDDLKELRKLDQAQVKVTKD